MFIFRKIINFVSQTFKKMKTMTRFSGIVAASMILFASCSKEPAGPSCAELVFTYGNAYAEWNFAFANEDCTAMNTALTDLLDAYDALCTEGKANLSAQGISSEQDLIDLHEDAQTTLGC